MIFKGQIIITTNGTIITPYRKGMCKALERNTSSYDKIYHRVNEVTGFMLPYKGVNSFITHTNQRGYLQSLLPDYELMIQPDVRGRDIQAPYQLNSDIELKPLQKEIFDEVINSTNYKEWFINMQTALGKTLLSVALISEWGEKALILCYSETIRSQWIKTFDEKTNFDMSRIKLISASKTFQKVLDGEFDVNEHDIYVCTPGLITNFGKTHGNEKIDIVMRMLGIGVRVYDEANRDIANIVKNNAFANISKTLYLSADYAQPKSERERMFFAIFRNTLVLKPSVEEMRSLKYTQAIVVEYNSYPSETESQSIYNRYGFSAQAYMEYQLNNDYIFDALEGIFRSIAKANVNNYRTLILVTNVEHADRLCDWVLAKYGDSYTVGKVHGGVSADDKAYARDTADIIVSTYGSFGVGVDASKIKFVISLNQSNKVEDNQAAGRARPLPDNSDAFYFMIMDSGFPYCKNKLSKRLEYLQQTKIKKITRIKNF